MAHSWDRPTVSPTGDFDEKFLFECVGRALSEWEQVESACAELFAAFVLSPKRKPYLAPAIRAYGTVVSFRGRADMLRAAAAAYFLTRKPKATSFEDQLGVLLKEYLGFADRRNEIAHGTVLMLNRNFGHNRPKRPLGFYLFPSFFNPKKYKLDRSIVFQYNSKDLIHFRQEFTKLKIRLLTFRTRLDMFPSSRKKHP
jgi:hypothetical protein